MHQVEREEEGLACAKVRGLKEAGAFEKPRSVLISPGQFNSVTNNL